MEAKINKTLSQYLQSNLVIKKIVFVSLFMVLALLYAAAYMVGYYSHIHQQKHAVLNSKIVVCYRPNSTKMESPFGDTEFYDTRYYEFGKIKIFSNNNTPDLIFDYIEAGYDRCVLTKRTDR